MAETIIVPPIPEDDKPSENVPFLSLYRDNVNIHFSNEGKDDLKLTVITAAFSEDFTITKSLMRFLLK